MGGAKRLCAQVQPILPMHYIFVVSLICRMANSVFGPLGLVGSNRKTREKQSRVESNCISRDDDAIPDFAVESREQLHKSRRLRSEVTEVVNSTL